MERKIQKFLLLAVALFVVQSVWAWSGVGHSAIAYAAEQMLRPEVKEKCHHYLGTTVTYQASWMDAYRSIKPYTACDEWHSTNIDTKGKVVKGLSTTGAYHIVRICNEMMGGKYKQMPDSLVKINLQYLIHMIGDHHCLVHVRWNKESHPEMSYSVKRKGKKWGSHGFWDSSPAFKRKGWTCERYYANMQKLSPAEVKRVVKGDGYTWTQETANTARKNCLRLAPPGTETTKYSKEDVAAIHEVVDRQMQLAAYRLAYVLNEIFKE